MVFKALQTYSDGTVARWIEEPAAGRRGAGEPGAGAHPDRRVAVGRADAAGAAAAAERRRR